MSDAAATTSSQRLLVPEFDLAVNGTTGDSMNLSDDERRKLGEAWMAASAKYGTVIMNHIGCNSITATCELAAHAEKIGCHAIAAMPPFFFKPRHAKDIAIWLKQVSDAAPRTPLYYYHFNAITGVFVDPLDIIKACEELGVPTFRGFKFTDYNLFTFANCLNYKEGKYDVLYARDEATLGGVATGARGHIGNAFNYAAGLYHRLRAAFASGDITAARLEQERANKLVLVMQDSKYGGQALAINVSVTHSYSSFAGGPGRSS